MSYRFDVITIFPELMSGYLAGSIVGRAIEAGMLEVGLTNPRDFTDDPHRKVDDTPFGGGAGMVMTPEPLARAIEHVRDSAAPSRIILMTPAGRPLTQRVVRELAGLGSAALVCGRYEGVDERVRTHFVDDEISVGDFVLTGGELPALAIIDAVSRLVPGVVGNPDSPVHESFSDAPLLEHPHYTRPRSWRGHEVPEVLLSGHLAEIEAWRQAQRLARTAARRPDLLGDDPPPDPA